MQCLQIRRMLLNYALDDARVTERLCVDVHLTHCTGCRRELEDLCELVHASDRALAHPAPRDDFDGLMARIAADEAAVRESRVRVPFRWRRVAMRVGAAAAVVAVVLFTAPLLRQTERVVDDFREATTVNLHEKPQPVQVPVVTQPFVERMQAVSRGEEPKTDAR